MTTSDDREPLRDTLLLHHPLARSRTGLLTGCRCGEVRLGEDVIQHVMEKLLDGPLAPLLNAAFVVNRVEALAEEWERLGPYAPTSAASWQRDGLKRAAAALRAVLPPQPEDGQR